MARRSVRVTDAQWAKIEPHLPRTPRSRKGGRPRVSHRDVVDGILWVLKTGARWRDLPEGYPSGSTCWRRLRDWDEDGTWLDMWRAFLGELDARGRIRWEHAFIDGSFASAKKGALTSAKPSGGRVRSGWWWSTARVFLWEYMSPRPAQAKSRSSTRR
jgi:transposase